MKQIEKIFKNILQQSKQQKELNDIPFPRLPEKPFENRQQIIDIISSEESPRNQRQFSFKQPVTVDMINMNYDNYEQYENYDNYEMEIDKPQKQQQMKSNHQIKPYEFIPSQHERNHPEIKPMLKTQLPANLSEALMMTRKQTTQNEQQQNERKFFFLPNGHQYQQQHPQFQEQKETYNY